jgi:hypothetical protein
LPNQFTLALQGVGGTVKVAGFYLDSLTIPAANGKSLTFTHAPVLVDDITITRDTSSSQKSCQGSWLFDTGAASSIISTQQAATLGVTYSSQEGEGFGSDDPTLVDAQGNALPDQFTLSLQGVGGTVSVAGFYLDSLTIPAANGKSLTFTHAPVLVDNISITDPNTGDTYTLDGVFGMNYLFASAYVNGQANLATLQTRPGAFDFVTYDEKTNTLMLTYNQAVVPEPATLATMAAGSVILLTRRHKHKQSQPGASHLSRWKMAAPRPEDIKTF